MSEPFIGEIRIVAFNFAPRGWANCDGGLLPISSYSALFSLVGTMYGGNGSTTFALPDLRGRVPIHTGNGPTLSPRNQGSQAGQERVTLTGNELPPHAHPLGSNGQVPSTTAVGDRTTPDGNLPARANDGESNYSGGAATGGMRLGGSTESAGGNQSHDNMPPFLTVRFVIALVGIFPSRN